MIRTIYVAKRPPGEALEMVNDKLHYWSHNKWPTTNARNSAIPYHSVVEVKVYTFRAGIGKFSVWGIVTSLERLTPRCDHGQSRGEEPVSVIF